MSLPIQNAPIYTTTVPSTKKEFKFRPFLVKEEKALLIAQQSDDLIVMVDTLKEVIKSCAKSKIDIDALSVFDIEFLFTQIRARSVGEIVELIFNCDTCEDEKASVKIAIDLTKINVQSAPEHSKKINLFDDVGIIMKYPSIDILEKFPYVDVQDLDQVFEIVIECVESIYDSKEIYYTKDQKREDILEFLNNLTKDQFEKIQSFFETMPKLTYNVKYKCPLCSKDHNKVLEGLSNFF